MSSIHTTLEGIVACTALLGTSLQAYEALLQLREHRDRDLHHTIDEWRNEVPAWHLAARRRQRRTLRALGRESPAEWAAFRRLELILASWSALIVASLAAVIGVFV